MKIYVLHVQTGKERDIKAELLKLALQPILPTEIRLERCGGQWLPRERILMPGYVFIEVDYTAAVYYRIKAIPGVIRILGSPQQPFPLSDTEASFIRAMANNNRPMPPVDICIGPDGKAILTGPLADNGAWIAGLDRHRRRAYLRIDIAGEQHCLTVSVNTHQKQ